MVGQRRPGSAHRRPFRRRLSVADHAGSRDHALAGLGSPLWSAASGKRAGSGADTGRRPHRRTNVARTEDPVHAAMAERQAARYRALGFAVGIDEPYQHYQLAGRADLVAWDLPRRSLIHHENRTPFPNLQEVAGSFNAKREYLAPVIAERLGLKGTFRSVTHVMVVLWSAEALHALKLRTETFRSLCPDPPDAFEQWWAGRPPETGTHRTLVVFDPAADLGRRATFRGLDPVSTLRPRYAGYREAASALEREQRS